MLRQFESDRGQLILCDRGGMADTIGSGPIPGFLGERSNRSDRKKLRAGIPSV